MAPSVDGSSMDEPVRQSVTIPAGSGVMLQGDLEFPTEPVGLVAFAHGSGSSRLSPRNRYVAEELRNGCMGTLLVDLLSEEEEREDLRTRELRFDIALLAGRMVQIVDWVRAEPATAKLPVGLFGASTGAAAALIAAARKPKAVHAVVSRGGRPDLAAEHLPNVRAATLLIVGERDPQVLKLNRQALERLAGPKELSVVPGATHLFEEADTLEEVARLAREWFVRRLAG